MEALLYESEPSSDRAGVLIGMVACAASGGLVGFILGIVVGIWL